MDQPALMILDNHDSHLSIEALDFAKANGIVMVTIPPHCSHKVQPLDCAVFGPFKRHYNTAVKSWILDNPGKPLTIYNIPHLVASAFSNAMTISNIMSGFRVTGIYPYNPDVHSKEDFAPSLVTDCPNPTPVASLSLPSSLVDGENQTEEEIHATENVADQTCTTHQSVEASESDQVDTTSSLSIATHSAQVCNYVGLSCFSSNHLLGSIFEILLLLEACLNLCRDKLCKQ